MRELFYFLAELQIVAIVIGPIDEYYVVRQLAPAILVKERFRIHLVLIFVGTQPSGHYNQRVNGRSVLDGLFFHRNFFSVVRI